MPEATAQVRRAAHLPEQPRQALGAGRRFGREDAPNFSARYCRIAPDSNTRIGVAPLRSSKAGIFEFGFTATKPLPNWSPSPILISQASYSAPVCPRASSSSSRIVTFCPLGVASEYSCSGCLPTGSTLSVGRPGDGPVDTGERAADFRCPRSRPSGVRIRSCSRLLMCLRSTNRPRLNQRLGLRHNPAFILERWVDTYR